MDNAHGPYYYGLGKKRLRDVSSQNEGTEYSNFFLQRSNSHESPPVAKKPRITHLEVEVIPKFDPSKKTMNVKGWLHKIDQLGDMYDWEERDKIFVMQTRLRGAARDWYDDLDDYDATWNQWKDKLTKAFPRSTDFVDRLEEMLARKKTDDETMTHYYHDKISLIKKCGLEGENAISCLIRGLPVELRANAKACSSKTPEELYYGLLFSLENYKKVEARPLEVKSTWQRGSGGGYNMPKVCYNCRKTGHEIRDCRAMCCQICQRPGHAANTCWYAAGTSQELETSQRNQQGQQQKSLEYTEQQRRSGPRQIQDGRVLQLRPPGATGGAPIV